MPVRGINDVIFIVVYFSFLLRAYLSLPYCLTQRVSIHLILTFQVSTPNRVVKKRNGWS